MKPPRLTYASEKGPNAPPYLQWAHDVVADAGSKTHLFSFQTPGGTAVTECIYRSGDTGESLGIRQIPYDINKRPRPNPEGFQVKILKPQHIPLPDRPDSLLIPAGTVMPADINAGKIKDAMEKGEITPEQRHAALIMLASLYRLVATRYHGEFGYNWKGKPYEPSVLDTAAYKHLRDAGLKEEDVLSMDVVGSKRYTRPLRVRDMRSLEDFVQDPEALKDANRCIALAARYLTGKEVRLERPGKLLHQRAYHSFSLG